MTFIEELRWRGLLAELMPGTEEQLEKESTKAYIGFDPTANSLHIGNLIPIKVLVHFQKHGHYPIALVGGATGMIGDPSGKNAERNMLDDESLKNNVKGIRTQLEHFLDFSGTGNNPALLVNNYDWMREISFLDFAKNVGKNITVNYMMAKDSVKKRLTGDDGAEGMSFTEFTYQLIQGYDFLHLYNEFQVKLQMGGTDQWGNITTGTELIRRKSQGQAFALTIPLITKSDGTKFGKSEGGANIWLDKKRTSPFKFYQFWLNTSDEDAEKFIKMFTFLDQNTIEKLIFQHKEAPHQRILQKTLAKEVTTWVHSIEDLEKAENATAILFGKSTREDFENLDDQSFLEIFEGVPMAEVSKEKSIGVGIVDVLSDVSGFLSSKGEARRELKANAISVNKNKIDENFILSEKDIIASHYILLQKGKKQYFILKLLDEA